MVRYFLSIIIVLGLLVSCEDDSICIEQTTPHLIMRFAPTNQTNTMDSLIIYREAKDGKFYLINKGLARDSVMVSLPVDNQNQARLVVGTSTLDRTKQDLLTINYDYQLRFVSKACGFGVDYMNTKYTITNNVFNSIEILQNEITNEGSAHIQLNY